MLIIAVISLTTNVVQEVREMW